MSFGSWVPMDPTNGFQTIEEELPSLSDDSCDGRSVGSRCPLDIIDCSSEHGSPVSRRSQSSSEHGSPAAQFCPLASLPDNLVSPSPERSLRIPVNSPAAACCSLDSLPDNCGSPSPARSLRTPVGSPAARCSSLESLLDTLSPCSPVAPPAAQSPSPLLSSCSPVASPAAQCFSLPVDPLPMDHLDNGPLATLVAFDPYDFPVPSFAPLGTLCDLDADVSPDDAVSGCFERRNDLDMFEFPDESFPLEDLPGPDSLTRLSRKRPREHESDEVVALGHAWDRRHRCLGDHIHGHSAAHHPQTWDAENCVRIAVSAIAAGGPHAVRETSHDLTAMCVTVEAVWEAQAQLISDWYHRALTQPKAQFLMESRAHAPQSHWVSIVRGFDSTPHDVEFGSSLTAKLMPIARFRYKDLNGDWTLISYERMQELGIRRKRGVLELLGQRVQLVWSEVEQMNTNKYLVHWHFSMMHNIEKTHSKQRAHF